MTPGTAGFIDRLAGKAPVSNNGRAGWDDDGPPLIEEDWRARCGDDAPVAHGTDQAPTTAAADHERHVLFYLDQARARREAQRRLDAEGQDATPPGLTTLRDRLAVPTLPPPSRIAGWQMQHSRVMLAAQFKSGKTTLVGNLIRSLVDGDLFLGRDAVTAIDGTLGLLDFEMSPYQADDWLRQQRIRNDDRIVVASLRGKAASFNILDDRIRGEWAARFRLHGCAYLILDCLRPVLDALGLDEHHDAGRFLVAYDALMAEAGIAEALVVHHMGHTGERARGDSRLRDWPDAEWRLVRRDDNPSSPRFLTAYGRDVDVPESQLDFAIDGRRLTIAGGNRHDLASAEALDDVLAALAGSPVPLSSRAIERACKVAGSDHGRDRIRASIAFGIQHGYIVTEPGPRQAILHRGVA